MIFKRLIDRINFSNHNNPTRRATLHSSSSTLNASEILPVNSQINRNFSEGDALSQIGKARKHIDLENEILSFASSPINQSLDHVNEINDQDSENLHLHHDHNTKHLFRHMNHFSGILQQLNAMRKDEKMCDVTLVLDGDLILCHKYILGANSPYFLALFTNGFYETNKRTVELKDIHVKSLRLLIDFIYTGEIVITENNVQNLLSTANLLQINSVKEACSQFIQSHLDLDNCIGIREFAEGHFCPVLQKHAEAFIEQYYGDIILREEFYSLNVDQLIKIISKDHISVDSEMVILKSVIRWMNSDKENRYKSLPEIMKHVRLPLMEKEELLELLTVSLFKENEQILDIIKEAIDLQVAKPAASENSCHLDLAFIRPRIPLGLPRKMILFGGQAPKASNKANSYIFRLQKWESLNDMPTKRSRAGCITHEDMIYLIGGYNGQSRTRAVDIYDPVADEWTSGVGMHVRRGTLGVGYLNNKIYAIGGYDGNIGLMSSEEYDPSTKTWTMIANMSVRRSSVGVASLHNYIFAIGGYCGVNKECLDSVERYDPVTDTWKIMAKMNMKRSGASVGVYDGKIYVAGGHDGPRIHNSVEVYDFQKNKWKLTTEMNTCRRNASFIINNGLIYVIGGDNGKDILSSVEVFNVQRNVWSFMPNYLPEARSYISCIVIDNCS